VRPHEALGMQTPAQVYVPSAREYPRRIPELEYPDTMLVRRVKSHGHFRWKQSDVFLSEVLWGEPVGLLSVDERWFTVYFAQVPLARFDSWRRGSSHCRKTSTWMGQGKRARPLTLHPILQNPRKCQACARSKMSGMCPSVHCGNLLAAHRHFPLRVRGRSS
jgi:hypothetical protein